MTDHSLPSTNNAITQETNTQQNASKKATKIAIIGGGLTGLFTATLLERAFKQQDSDQAPQITIFEKSRSVGRLATRYRTDEQTSKNWQWAFGAQFFTAKSASFQQFITPWLETSLLQPWCAQVIDLTPANNKGQSPVIKQKEQWDTTHARYISTPKMTSWGRALADDLHLTTVHFKTHVAPLSKPKNSGSDNQQTELFDAAGASLGLFDWVICTAPNGQAVALMADSNFSEHAQITKPQMQACYTLMLAWDGVAQLPEALSSENTETWDVAYVQDSPLDRIFIEHQKPAHSDLLPSITIHARNDWSEAYVDDDIETITAQLLAAAQQALNWNSDSAPSQVDCHRWRYAATVNNTDYKSLGILVDQQQQLIVSGDWCGQGNIESCYQMAAETVQVLMNNE